VTSLKSGKRRELRDSAFAYVDSTGRRRLPINDESHVRNALARFNQVLFEDDAARDRARTRLLRAAKKYGIVPIGFMDGQLRANGPRSLPSGAVTFLLTDIQDSTGLVNALGDRYAAVLADTRRLIRVAIRRAGGREVDARADEFFAVFRSAPAAVEAAVEIQREMASHAWPDGRTVRARIGLHTGRPTRTPTGYQGISVNAASRLCACGHGGQTLLSRAVRAALADAPTYEMRHLGSFRLRGIPDEHDIYQLLAPDLVDGFPPLRLEEGATTGYRIPH
jgi:class 3 adenylate cyclase